MTEVLIVIGIIVLMIAIAVPAFNLIRGGRSLDAAENQIAAVLGRARADAIGLQKPHGVMFFLDNQTDRVQVAEVFAADFPDAGAPTRDVYLDLVADRDFVPFPPGVLGFVLNDSGGGARDRYLGYNPEVSTGGPSYTPLGGVILFDGNGQLINRTYGYRTSLNGLATRMWALIGAPSSTPAGQFVEAGPATFSPPTIAPSSSLGFLLCDREGHKNNGSMGDPLFAGGAGATNAAETGEEAWLDENGTPLIINRYNGTLTQGQ
jgi:type II secretory pathway pseudopilin PulG